MVADRLRRCPSPRLASQRFAPGGNRLVGKPVFNVLGQGSHAFVTISGFERHCAFANGGQRRRHAAVELTRRRIIAALHLLEYFLRLSLECLAAREQAVQDRAQAVHVARGADCLEVARGLLGTHVDNRAQHRPEERPVGIGQRQARERVPRSAARGILTPDDFDQPPVENERLPVQTQHDVAGLQVAVDESPAVCVRHGIAHVENPPQQFMQLERALSGIAIRPAGHFVEPCDLVLQARALDESHGVEGAAVAIVAQTIDRDDPRMLEVSRGFRFKEEPPSNLGIIAVLHLDSFERDVAVQLLIGAREMTPRPPLSYSRKTWYRSVGSARGGIGKDRFNCTASSSP